MRPVVVASVASLNNQLQPIAILDDAPAVSQHGDNAAIIKVALAMRGRLVFPPERHRARFGKCPSPAPGSGARISVHWSGCLARTFDPTRIQPCLHIECAMTHHAAANLHLWGAVALVRGECEPLARLVEHLLHLFAVEEQCRVAATRSAETCRGRPALRVGSAFEAL